MSKFIDSEQPEVTLCGNLVATPKIGRTSGGVAVANFTIACTPRRFDVTSGTWSDGVTTFYAARAFRGAATRVAKLEIGTPLIVQGHLRQHAHTNRDGERIIRPEIDVENLGPNIKHVDATVPPRAKRTEPTRVVTPASITVARKGEAL